MGKVGLVTRGVPMLLDPLPGGRHLIDGIEFIVSWARANSLWPLVYGTACCAMEMMSTGGPRHDWARFGVEVARATPRQADLIVLAGTIVEKMSRPLVTLYQQMPGPKYVIAMGSCAISGGPFFYDSYSVVKGGDRLIPVDVYIPGCPPRPEALLYGIMQLQKIIRTEGRRNPWKVKDTYQVPATDSFLTAKNNWAETVAQQTLPTRTEAIKPARLVKPDYPQVTRQPQKIQGLTGQAILAQVQDAFPAVRTAGSDGLSTDDLPVPGTTTDLIIPTKNYLELVAFLKNRTELNMDFLQMITAVDWPDRFDVVSRFLSTSKGHAVIVRTPVDRDEMTLPSLTPIFKTAAWHEREIYDMFGIRFTDHPDMRRLFLEDDFTGHPLRKDYQDNNRIIPRPY